MDFSRLEQYQQLFYQGDWLQKENEQLLKESKEIRKRADLLLEDQVVFTDCLDMEACENPYSLSKFKWNTSPTNDSEWIFMLNRQGYLLDLAMCYRMTLKEKYLVKYKEILFQFIEKNGAPSEASQRSWRTIDTGIRLMNWIKSWTYLDVLDTFNRQEQELLQQAIHIHVDYILTTFLPKIVSAS